MGIGLGLKSTVITYCLASGITLMVCYKYINKPVKSIFLFAIGGVLGYLIFNGYFMYKYQLLYNNPFFPFLNGIFHSSYFFDLNYRDARFVPPYWKIFVFPCLYEPLLNAYLHYKDIRLLIIYNLPILFFISLIVKDKIKFFFKEKRELTTAFVFLFLSLLIWIPLFFYGRYAIVIETMGVLLSVKLFDLYNHKKHRNIFYIHIILIFAMVLNMLAYPHKEMAHKTKIIDLQKIDLPDNTLVKIYEVPASFVIPEIAKNKTIKTVTHYRKCTNFLTECRFDKGTDFAEYGPFLEKRNKIEQEHKGPVIYIYNKSKYKMKLNEKQLAEDYEKQKNFYQKAISLGFLKDSDDYLGALKQKYKEDLEIAKQNIAQDYICQKLKNNLEENLRICVPKKLKKQILGK